MLTDTSPAWTGAAVALARRRTSQSTYKLIFAIIFTVPLFVVILGCCFLTRRWWSAGLSSNPEFYQRRVAPEEHKFKNPELYDAWTKEEETTPSARWMDLQPVFIEMDHLSSPITPSKEGLNKEMAAERRHPGRHLPQTQHPVTTLSSQRPSATIGVLISMPASTSDKHSLEGTRLALGVAEASMNERFEPVNRRS